MDKEDHEQIMWINQQVDRQIIIAIYKSVLKSPLPEEWKGRNGTFAHIAKISPGRSLTTIEKVVPEV